MKYPEVAGVSFDVWKTLVKSNPEYKPARDTYIASELSLPLEAARQSIREVDVQSDDETDRTGKQFGPIDRLARIALRHDITLSNTMVEGIARDIQELFLEYPLNPNEPDIDATLRELAKTRRIALTSNTGFIDGVYMRRALDRIGILESTTGQVFSDEINKAKPSPAIFEATALSLGLSNEDIVHVGDNPVADYEGALTVGMRAVLLRDDQVNPDGIVSAPTVKDAVERGLL